VTSSYDVIVVGGGAIGAACARELATAKRRVLVLDRGGDEGDAWQAAAGLLAPQIEARAEDPMFELGLAAREHYATLAQALRSTTGIDIGLWQEGVAQLAGDDARAAELRSKVAWQRQQGHLCDWLDAAEVRERWPWAGRSQGALWAPREGALEPQKLVTALHADAARLGATLRHDEVFALARSGERVTGVIGSEHYSAENVVIAAGAWSNRIESLPRPISVEPVRGQMAAFDWPAAVPRGILFGQDGYLLHRGGQALVGATMEYVGYRADTTEEGLAQLSATAKSICPALGDAPVRRTWAGLRPMTPDGLPIVGRQPDVTGLWYATGHGRNGILLAGITGLIMRQLLDGGHTVEEAHVMRPSRFWRW
jgi:glycine oxidase